MSDYGWETGKRKIAVEGGTLYLNWSPTRSADLLLTVELGAFSTSLTGAESLFGGDPAVTDDLESLYLQKLQIKILGYMADGEDNPNVVALLERKMMRKIAEYQEQLTKLKRELSDRRGEVAYYKEGPCIG